MATSMFWKQFGVAVLVAMVGVLVVWLIASLVSPDILVDTPSDENQNLDWWGPSLAIIFPYGIVAAIVAWLLVRFQKPRIWWYAIAAVALIATGIQAFMQANTTESAIWLNIMHLVAAGCIVPTVARFLPNR